MIHQDDRSTEQKKTHTIGVVMRDSFLSGWGEARGGYSRAAWACGPDISIDRVERWVRHRTDAKYVHVVDLSTYRPPRGTVHYHIYVCGPDHPATKW
jgi:hypothetical protein